MFIFQPAWGARVFWSLTLAILLAALVRPASADDFKWANPVNGIYTTAANWTLLSGVGPPPPGVGDTALFDANGSYVVTLSVSPVASDSVQVAAGTVTFKENVVGGGIYNVTTGAADVSITGAATTLNLGVSGDPAALNIGDDLLVQSGGTLNVNFGSSVTTGDLILATFGGGSTNTIVVDGSGSSLSRTNGTAFTIGQNGATGNLTYSNSANGDINGTLFLANSGIAGSTANLNVQSNADLQLDSLNIGTGTVATATGTVTLTGAGSTITQSGASTLTIGTASGGVGNLNINSSGVFTSGTGTITVNTKGTINFASGGVFNANGTANISGDVFVIGANCQWLSGTKTVNLTGGALMSVFDGAHLQAGAVNINAGASDSSLLNFGTTATAALGSVTMATQGTSGFNSNMFLATGNEVAIDDLAVATVGLNDQRGTVFMNGGILTVSDTLTLGANTTNSTFGRIELNTNPGTLNTGMGLTLIRQTGRIQNNTGTVNFGGDVTIDGGEYLENQAGAATRTFAPDSTLTIQNGGVMTLNTSGLTVDAGRALVLSGSTSQLNLEGSFESMSIGGVFDSTSGTLTLSNSAQLTLGALGLRANHAGQVATLNVLAGADLFIDGSSVFSIQGSNTEDGQAIINIDGSGSNIIITNAAGPLVLGQSTGTGTTATMNVTGNGQFISDDNELIVNPLGMVHFEDGALHMNGDLLVLGGTIETAAGTTGIIAMEAFLDNELRIVDGGSVALRQSIFGLEGNRLTVDGPGSSFTLSGDAIDEGSFWMRSENGSPDAVVTISNGATASTRSFSLATAGFASGGMARVEVNSGGTLTTDHLGIGRLVFDNGFGLNDDFPHPAEMNIDGPGSKVTIRNGYEAHVGSTLEDAVNVGQFGTLNLTGGGELDTTGGTLFINRAGIVNLDGGVLNAGAIVFDYEGQFNFNSGTLSTTSNLLVDNTQLLGPTVDLPTGKHLATTGTTMISSVGSLTLNGGSLKTSDVIINSGGTFAFNSGSLDIDGLDFNSSGLLGATETIGANKSINVGGDVTLASNAEVTLSGGSLAADNLQVSGHLVYDGGTLAVNALMDVLAGGRVFITNNRTLAPGSPIDNVGRIELGGGLARLQGAGSLGNTGLVTGSGQIDMPITNFAAGELRVGLAHTLEITGAMAPNAGRINLQGGTLDVAGALTNAAGGEILGRGTLSVGGAGLTNNGHVAFSSGITDVFGDLVNNTGNAAVGITVSGNADATFWDDVNNVAGSLFRVSNGSSATFFGTFSGAGISGPGSVYFEADVTPGASPATATFGGSVNLGINSDLVIELGGTTPGAQYDQLQVSGALSLEGALEVALINGFMPAAGNTFDILDWGTLSGTFSSITLPTLSGALTWNTDAFYTTGILSVVAPLHPGDFDGDGDVDGADFVAWQTHFPTATGATLTDGDADGDGDVDGADFVVWQTNFPYPPSAVASPVPEPAAVFLAVLAGVVLLPLVSRTKCCRVTT